jgi:nickel/cobalt exporter
MTPRPAPIPRRGGVVLFGLVLLGLALAGAAAAQGYHHPFAVGANEGALGHVSGLTAWIVERQSDFYRLLSGAVRDIRDDRAAGFELAGLSFAYGAFHAAGPGHGKAVVTSYLVANEATLRRGLAIAALAALLQGLVAIALVGVAAMLFHATAARMTQASVMLEYASYAAIIGLGLVLAWRKGAGLVAALRPVAGFDPERLFRAAPRPATAGGTAGFAADDGTPHGPGLCDCGHAHIPDPATLARGFSWRGAGVTILSAGARPCSGAILVLVFALAQGIFLAGVGAALAMAGGVALTTGLLAGFAVYAKSTAQRLVAGGARRHAWLVNLIEFGAALCVVLFGVALLAASLGGMLPAG